MKNPTESNVFIPLVLRDVTVTQETSPYLGQIFIRPLATGVNWGVIPDSRTTLIPLLKSRCTIAAVHVVHEYIRLPLSARSLPFACSPDLVQRRWLRFRRGVNSSKAEVTVTGCSSSATLPPQHPFPGTTVGTMTDSPSSLTMLAAASILEYPSNIVSFCSHCSSLGVVGQSLSSQLLSWSSSWEKLRRKLACLITTLIKRVIAGAVGGGGGGNCPP